MGEIVDEQTVDGLIGKVLASQHRVSNYHYHLFHALNDAGRLLIIFDGLDEMKHGMTLSMFEQNINNLLGLDRGNSRILLLGRDTVFRDDVEFQAIVQGRQTTAGGRVVVARGRRPLRHVTLQGFKLEEARWFVEHYFVVKATELAAANSRELNQQWVAARVRELLSGRFDELMLRPVHAQMLCEIAADPEEDLSGGSIFDLYDRFIHYLIDREVRKPGRYPNFTVPVRRKFNAAVAWWLWDKATASTTTLADVPITLCYQAVGDTPHDLDEVGLKRELTTGCLIEKGGQTIYFGHRSLQEFLVAEYLWSTRLLEDTRARRCDLGKVWALLTNVISDFLIEWLRRSDVSQVELSRYWLQQLELVLSPELNIASLQFFSELVGAAKFTADEGFRSAWLVLLSYFRANGTFFGAPENTTIQFLKEARRSIDTSNERAIGALVSLCAFAVHYDFPDRRAVLDEFIQLLLPVELVAGAVERARRGVSAVVSVRRDQQPGFWCFLSACQITRDTDTRESVITLDLRELMERATVLSRLPLARWDILVAAGTVISVPVAEFQRRVGLPRVPRQQSDLFRAFFNDDKMRTRIRPLEVAISPARLRDTSRR